MKRIGLIVTFGMVASLVFGQFQGFEWGASRNDVIAGFGETEELSPILPDELGPFVLTYMDLDVNPVETWVFSFLESDELAKGIFVFSWNGNNSRPAWQKLEQIRPILYDKYGEPFHDELQWKTSASKLEKQVFEDDPFGAIHNQLAEWSIRWESDDLILDVWLERSDEDYILVGLSYSDPEHLDQLAEEVISRDRIQY